MQNLQFNAANVQKVVNAPFLPSPAEWPKIFGLPSSLVTLIRCENGVSESSTEGLFSELHKIVPNGMNITPALYRFWHWLLVGQHEQSALKLMQGMKSHRIHNDGQALRKAIREVAKLYQDAAVGKGKIRSNLWDNYMTHYFVYGGGYNTPTPHVSAQILAETCKQRLSFPRELNAWGLNSPIRAKFLQFLREEAEKFKKQQAKKKAA